MNLPKVGQYINCLFFSLLVLCMGCVPISQQITESEDPKIAGFVGPLTVDAELFNYMTAPLIYDRMTIDDQLLPSNKNATYEGTFDSKFVYIRNCKCLENPEIVQNKLVVKNSYGGGGSNRESTILLWNGKYYRNSKGEYIVDVILFSDKVDIRKAMIIDRKVLDIAGIQREGVPFIWINLIGHDGLIKYKY